MEQPLNNWQHGEHHEYFSVIQEIIDKTVVYDAAVARHAYLVSLVPKECIPENEAEILLMSEINRNMQNVLTLMGELEQLCLKVSSLEPAEST